MIALFVFLFSNEYQINVLRFSKYKEEINVIVTRLLLPVRPLPAKPVLTCCGLCACVLSDCGACIVFML